MTKKDASIARSVNQSIENGTPIPIEHLHLVDVKRHFSEAAIRERKLRKTSMNIEEKKDV